MNEKAQKVRKTYDSLKTMEEKFEYILEYNVYQLAMLESGEQVSKDEGEINDQIQDEFINEYVVNADEKTAEKVFRTLGKFTAKNNAEMLHEKNSILKSIPEDDPLRDKKSYWLARNGKRPGIMLPGINMITTRLQAKYTDDHSKPGTEAWKNAGITKDTTLREYAIKVGYRTEEDINKFLEDNEAKADDKFFDHVKKGLGDDASDKTVNREMYQYYLADQYRMWSREGGNEYINERYAEDEAKEIAEIGNLNVAETSKSGIKDWIKEEGENKANGYLPNVCEKIKAVHEAQYDKDLRAGKTTEEVFPWLFEKDDDGEYDSRNLTEKEKQIFAEDIQLDFSKDAAMVHEADGERMNVNKHGDSYLNVFAGIDRSPSINAVFTIWALGTQDDVNMTNFTQAAKRPELIEKFAKFCEDNKTLKATTEEEYRKSAKAWAEALKKGTDKVKNYKFPNIDYGNPDEVKKVLPKLYKLRAMTIDFSQEKDKSFANRNLPIDGKQIAAQELGEKKWNDMVEFWGSMQHLYGGLEYGYIQRNQIDKLRSTENAADNVISRAAARALAALDMNKAAGKTTVEAFKEFGEKRAYYFSLASDLSKMGDNGKQKEIFESLSPISREEAATYLRTKDLKVKRQFEKKIAAIQEKLKDYYRKDCTHDTCYEGMQDFRTHMVFGDKDSRDRLLNLDDNLQSTLDFIKNGKITQEGGKELTTEEWLGKNFKNLYTENYSALIEEAGMKKRDIILIDGRTPEQIWGKKYANVPENMKDKCYNVEVMKKIAEGNSNIRIKQFAINEQGKVISDGTKQVFKSAQEVRSLKVKFEQYKHGLKDMVSTLEDLQTRLLQTHEGKNINEAKREIGKTGSPEFREMESTLNDCIRSLKSDNLSPKQKDQKIKAFEKASKRYEEKRTWKVFSHKENGQRRLDISAEAGKTAHNMRTLYSNLRKELSSDTIIKSGMLGEAAMTLTDATDHFLDNYFRSVCGGEKEFIYQTKDMKVSEQELNDSLAGSKSIANEQTAFKDALRGGLNKMGKNLDSVLAVPKAKTSTYDIALRYVSKRWLERAMAKDQTPEQIRNAKASLERKLADGSFKKMAENLSKNAVFIQTVKNNKAGSYEDWKKIENNADKGIDHMKSSLNELTQDKDVSKYIIKGNFDDGNSPEKAKEERYNRLGDFVTKQILTDPAYRIMVQAIESDRVKYADVVKQTTQILKDKHVLEGQNFDYGSLRDKLNTGAFKELAVKTLTENAKRQVAENLPGKHIEKPAPEIAGPRI